MARVPLTLRMLVLLPLLFNLALSLGNGGMMHDLGSAWTLGLRVPEPVDLVAGRWLVLFAFCEAALGACRILVAGRVNRDWRYHALLLGASLSSEIAPGLQQMFDGLSPAAAPVGYANFLRAAHSSFADNCEVPEVLRGRPAACEPELPPLLMMSGMKSASTTALAISCSKKPMAVAVSISPRKSTTSHEARLRTSVGSATAR